MAEHSSIEWTDATLFGDALPRRCTSCREVKPIGAFKIDRSRADGHGYVCSGCARVSPTNVPNRIERAAARKQGKAWCRDCADWRPSAAVGKQGLCRHHQRAADRRLYADSAAHRHARKQHSISRHRGVEPLPYIAAEYLLEEFDGRCAYCPGEAETWDHVLAVTRGGATVPHNVVPCCRSCNSSKKDRDVWAWLEKTGRTPCDAFYDRIVLEDLHG